MRLESLQRLLSPLVIRMRLLVSRGVVKLVDDSLKIQGLQLQLLADEVRDDVQRFQQYGFTSVPLAGAEAIALSVGGSREHLVVISVDDRRYRLKELENGEVALYTDEGDGIHLKRGNAVEIRTQHLKVTGDLEVLGKVNARDDLLVDGDVKCEKDVRASGQVADGSSSMSTMRTVYNPHVHATAIGPTDPPEPGM